MTRVHECAVGFICGFLETSELRAGDFSHYRGLQLGMRLTAAAKEAAAISQAVRLEVQEAPQRELEKLQKQQKQRKREEEERLILEKARSVNKPNFRP